MSEVSEQHVDTPKKIRTDFLSPAVAVSLAWGLTHSSSSDENSRTIDAQKVRDTIRNIKEKADGAGDPERRYVMGVEALIEAWFRNLVMIINDRNKNFDQVAEMRETQVKNIQYYSKFSSDLQSLIPRLSSMTIGGVTVAVLFGDLLGKCFQCSARMLFLCFWRGVQQWATSSTASLSLP